VLGAQNFLRQGKIAFGLCHYRGRIKRRKSIIARKNHLRSPVSRAVSSGPRAKRLLRGTPRAAAHGANTSASVVVWEVRFQEAPKAPSMAAMRRRAVTRVVAVRKTVSAEANSTLNSADTCRAAHCGEGSRNARDRPPRPFKKILHLSPHPQNLPDNAIVLPAGNAPESFESGEGPAPPVAG
jgi:hypothetical protein